MKFHARDDAVYLKGLAQILFELFTKNRPPGAQDFTPLAESRLSSTPAASRWTGSCTRRVRRPWRHDTLYTSGSAETEVCSRLRGLPWSRLSPAAREAARCLGSPVLSPRHRPGAGGLARVQWRAQARSAALDLDTGRGGRVRKTLEKMAESTNPGLPRQRGDPLGLE